MNERTRAYLRGRFRDYYRRATVPEPPAADRREWGYVPFSTGDTTMVRHQSLLALGALESFLARERPRHVYFSAGYYDDPGAEPMAEKGWRGSDLVFDLDADHLPGVTPDRTPYPEMLATVKDALERLLDFLEVDFAFETTQIVFSGGRGYHVHVRDPAVRTLDRDARREIVEYIRGIDVAFDQLVTTEAVTGTAGRQSPAEKRTLDTEGGWSRRVHARLEALFAELRDMDEPAALNRLQEYDNIGSQRAQTLYRVATDNADAVAAGNIDVHPAVITLAQELVDETVAAERAPIDDPVTTDTHRLIRLPGSLHGGTGFCVTRIDRADLAAFDPLVDAVPGIFRGHDIAIDVTDCTDLPPYGEPEVAELTFGADKFTIPEGPDYYPEYLGVYLMTQGRAEKAKE